MKPAELVSIPRLNAVLLVGSGWSKIVHELYDGIDALEHPVKIINVKEKWGALRVYTDQIHTEVDALIKVAGERSVLICEKCGASGKIRNLDGRLVTLCNQHSGERV